MSSLWNFADLWETVAECRPQALAQVHGDTRLTWQAFDAHANGLASTFLRSGLVHQDKVALYLANDPAYLQSAFACLKASLVPVNTNYRYQDEELIYLWDNCDAAAVVFHGAFAERAAAVRQRCPKVRLWIHVDDGTGACPDWAIPYAQAAAPLTQRVTAPGGRSGNDLILIYTGGTTGRPRGVMWRQHDLFMASNVTGDPESADLAAVRQRLSRQAREGQRSPLGLPAAPLMHGTAFVFAATVLNRGGCVITLTQPSFDVHELLATIGREQVSDLCIVGDAFCRPMVDTLDAEPARWNLGSLKAVSSSGMMWSPANKQRLLAHASDAILLDFLNSSEASGMGRSISSRERSASAARFKLGQNALVIDEHNRPVAPGSGIAGRVAVRGGVPIGYYGDALKSAETFPVIDGVRYAIPGDYAIVEADGTITLLGRGSVSINTGGEKVFPEEVEECIKQLPSVRDAVVVGVPDERFGECVVALVEPLGSTAPEPQAVIDQVRAHLARYKTPRHVLLLPTLGRGPNGKADYRALRTQALELLAARARVAAQA